MESRLNPHQQPQHPASVLTRWLRLGAAAGAVELGIVLLVMGWNAMPPADTTSATNILRTTVQTAPVREAQLAPLPKMAAAPRTSPRASIGVASTAKDGSEVEICGFGTVTLRPDDPYPFQSIPVALRESALAAVEALMLASDDIQVRAAAHWIGIRRGKRDARIRIEQIARLAIGLQGLDFRRLRKLPPDQPRAMGPPRPRQCRALARSSGASPSKQ